MNDYLRFQKMITPVIIEVIFWIGTAICVLSGLSAMLGGMSNLQYGGALVAFIGMSTLVIGPLFVRICCEMIILLFRIHQKLCDIDAHESGLSR